MLTPATASGSANTWPSTDVENSLPKLFELTLAGVKRNSDSFCPLLLMGLRWYGRRLVEGTSRDSSCSMQSDMFFRNVKRRWFLRVRRRGGSHRIGKFFRGKKNCAGAGGASWRSVQSRKAADFLGENHPDCSGMSA